MTVSISSSAAIARAALLAAALGVCLGVGSATAEDALAPLKGQTIRYIIGGSAGGGTDRMGRMFATALGRALPDTGIHIQNIRGAGGSLAVAEVANATGGLVTMTFSNYGPIYVQLLQTAAAEFDLTKLKWIGSVGDNQRVLVMRKGLGPATIETLQTLDRQPVAAAAGIAGSPSYSELLLLNSILGLHMKVAADVDDPLIQTMMMSGDVDATLNSYASIKPMIDSGDAVPVLVYSQEDAPEALKGVPVLRDLAPKGKYDEVINLLETLGRGGRIIVAAPDTPADQVAALRAAFEKVVADPRFNADMKAGAFVVNAVPGKTVEARISSFFEGTGAFQATVKRTLACGQTMSDGASATCE